MPTARPARHSCRPPYDTYRIVGLPNHSRFDRISVSGWSLLTYNTHAGYNRYDWPHHVVDIRHILDCQARQRPGSKTPIPNLTQNGTFLPAITRFQASCLCQVFLFLKLPPTDKHSVLTGLTPTDLHLINKFLAVGKHFHRGIARLNGTFV